ncbi:hypothetical protein HNY73_010578 [Argiope bruennichi]|uniref:Uncharacterized protein n=1 Tax=Argiope bruennichi TaxID=94029 RepID=A0A8T0F3W0_ARGBR|nr:hypothetical protein HNY73_010578 [Argiope bruennichi]
MRSTCQAITLVGLKLMAAFIATPIGKYLLKHFPSLTKEIYLWSDSKIELHRVKGSSKMWSPFVSKRVAHSKH